MYNKMYRIYSHIQLNLHVKEKDILKKTGLMRVRFFIFHYFDI